jgi:hypothetical protein
MWNECLTHWQPLGRHEKLGRHLAAGPEGEELRKELMLSAPGDS